jgi:APA family basic amino acid/polyamine antiporter
VAPALERRLGLVDAIMLVVGSMIGSGIFIVSAETSRLVGAPGWLLAAWAIAGILTITGALCCAELAAMMPRAGGQYVFLREAYGPATGFLFGWALLLVIQTGTIAGRMLATAGVLNQRSRALVTSSAGHPRAVGDQSVDSAGGRRHDCALTITNGRPDARRLSEHLPSRSGDFAAHRGRAGGRWTRERGLHVVVVDPSANGWTPTGAQPGLPVTGGLALAMLLGRAMVGPLFAQSAWNNVTFAGGEVRDPGRTLPRALLFGCGAVVALYLLANLAYVVTLPLAGIQHAPQNRVATAAMQVIFGSQGTMLMAVAVIVSTFGCNNGLILAGARVSYAMARDGLFFSRIGRLNARHVPAAALALQGVWAAALTLPRTVTVHPQTGAAVYGNVYTQLLEYLIPADLVLYALMVLAVIVMRRKAPELSRPYRTWGYPMVPLAYIVIATMLIVDLAYLAPTTSGIGYLIVVSGVPVYWAWQKRAVRTVLANEAH